MGTNVKLLYEKYVEKLDWMEKLELLELLMKSTLELIGKEKGKAIPVSLEDTSEPLGKESSSSIPEEELTPLQRQLVNGPVMKEEDYLLFKEKKEHFSTWK